MEALCSIKFGCNLCKSDITFDSAQRHFEKCKFDLTCPRCGEVFKSKQQILCHWEFLCTEIEAKCMDCGFVAKRKDIKNHFCGDLNFMSAFLDDNYIEEEVKEIRIDSERQKEPKKILHFKKELFDVDIHVFETASRRIFINVNTGEKLVTMKPKPKPEKKPASALHSTSKKVPLKKEAQAPKQMTPVEIDQNSKRECCLEKGMTQFIVNG